MEQTSGEAARLLEWAEGLLRDAPDNEAVEIAWAAGLFDGEGTIGQQGNSVSVAIYLTDSDLVDHFYRVVGMGAVSGPTQRQPHLKPQWQWRAGGDAAVVVLEMLLPYLGKRRSARARAVLAKRAEAFRERTCPACGKAFRPESAMGAAKARCCSPACAAWFYSFWNHGPGSRNKTVDHPSFARWGGKHADRRAVQTVQAIAMWEAGERSVTRIAEEIGASRHAVSGYLAASGYRTVVRRSRNSLPEIGEKLASGLKV